MYELHEHEQYFFDSATLGHLAGFIATRWRAPCCLCAPLLGCQLAKRGVDVAILDIDERFAGAPGFRRFDIHRPEWLGRGFDVIVCDPPFFNLSLARLFGAIRILSRNDFDQALMISYLSRRSASILGTFAPFGLAPTGYHPGYQTVQKVARNDVEFYANIGETDSQILAAGP